MPDPAPAPLLPKLLVVDDDEEIRTQMKWALAKTCVVLPAGDRAEAVRLFRAERPLVVLLDLGLPPHTGTPEEGLAALAEILGHDNLTKVVIISGQNEKETALKAIGAGAYDVLNKPVDPAELRMLLQRAFHVAQLEREHRALQHQLNDDAFEGMLGTSPGMQGVFSSIRKVATSDAPVLVLGESGTGKERVALAIHRRGDRRNGPFVAINCSAIPETLIESELFGHEKGAFTGAHMQRKGRIEAANGGTLFLDEVGEIPLLLQVKLLRFLQEQRIERVGGRSEIEIDARVIAATNVDLKKSMAEGKFREDLYYRLAVVQLTLPPLRERGDDIQLLARHYVQQYAQENNRKGVVLGASAIRAIHQHSWPGNVRELQNRVRRAVIMSEGKRLSAQDLELQDEVAPPSESLLKDARASLEREMILNALRKHSGNISAAAAELGISRPTFYERMERLGVQKPA